MDKWAHVAHALVRAHREFMGLTIDNSVSQALWFLVRDPVWHKVLDSVSPERAGRYYDYYREK